MLGYYICYTKYCLLDTEYVYWYVDISIQMILLLGYNTTMSLERYNITGFVER